MSDRLRASAMGQGASYAPALSAIYLPDLKPSPATILEYLIERFPHVGAEVWRQRMSENKVTRRDGGAVAPETPYQPHITLHYFREVESEQAIPFEETILFGNEHLLVVDKPHFLPVVPSGPYVNENLLVRLRRRTGIENITPIHRIDRDTAGLVLFSLDPETRPLYHRLFAERAVTKEYLAIGSGTGSLEAEYTIESRLVQGDSWCTMQTGYGQSNAITHIRVIGRQGDRALFHLRPETGKKHQLRVHLLSIGFPIVNDRLYPHVHAHAPYDYTTPLQLLAWRLSFVDPVDGCRREFASGLRLAGNFQEM